MISPAKSRRIVQQAARSLGCTVKELKRAVAGSSVVPSTLVRRSFKEAAKKAGCTVKDVRVAIINEGASRRKTNRLTPGEARRLYEMTHSVEGVALARHVTLDEARDALSRPERRGRRPRPYDPAERARLLALLRQHGSTRLAAEACKISQTTFLRRIKEPAVRG